MRHEIRSPGAWLGSAIDPAWEPNQPQPGQRICDPACGTGGFFLLTIAFLDEGSQIVKFTRLSNLCQFSPNQPTVLVRWGLSFSIADANPSAFLA